MAVVDFITWSDGDGLNLAEFVKRLSQAFRLVMVYLARIFCKAITYK